MTSGSPSRSRYSRRSYKEKKENGFKQVNMWLPPDLAKPLVKIATDEVQPIGVIIEKMLRESLRRQEPFKLVFNEPKIPDLGRGET
jgi:hypothetical protein